MDVLLINLKKGYKKAAVQRTTAKGQLDAVSLAASVVKSISVEESCKREGPILLAVMNSQKVGPFLFGSWKISGYLRSSSGSSGSPTVCVKPRRL